MYLSLYMYTTLARGNNVLFGTSISISQMLSNGRSNVLNSIMQMTKSPLKMVLQTTVLMLEWLVLAAKIYKHYQT